MSAPIDLENVFVREIERNDNKTLQINQSEIGDVGCVVWDAALVLTKYLETADFDYGKTLQYKKIVELGSGTGVVGLMAASYGAEVIITDLAEFVPLMQLNIETNKDMCDHRVEARALKWGDDITNVYKDTDIVLVADCIYYEESLEPLVQTLTDLCGETTCVYCCYEERTTGNKPELQKKFFALVEDTFHIEKIPLERQDTHFCSDDIHVMKFRKKSKT